MNKRPEPAVQSLIAATTILALVAWSEGSIVINVPGLSPPTVNRGIK